MEWKTLSTGKKAAFIIGGVIVIGGIGVFLATRAKNNTAATVGDKPAVKAGSTSATASVTTPAKVNWILDKYGFNQDLANAVSSMSSDEIDSYYQYLKLKYANDNSTGGAASMAIPTELAGYIQEENDYYGIKNV